MSQLHVYALPYHIPTEDPSIPSVTGPQRERQLTDLLPASKVLVYTSFFTRNAMHTESLSGPFGKDRVFKQHIRAVGIESQEDTFGWTSSEALPKTAHS